MHGVDMSSTVVELREFALLHGVSLKGLRLKSDILAAIQMHFGVFARVDPGAHAAGLKLQQENALAAPLVVDEGPLLKVRGLPCSCCSCTTPTEVVHIHNWFAVFLHSLTSLIIRRLTGSSLEVPIPFLRSLPLDACWLRPKLTTL
jgi:hypothetical protein